MYRRKLLTLTLFISSMASLPLASGCSYLPQIHKIDVDQGNVITQDMVNQLKLGISRRQVRYLMGSSMLESPFHTDHLHYIYRLHSGGEDPRQKQITLYFDQNVLARIEGDFQPQPSGHLRGKPLVSVIVPPKTPKSKAVSQRLLDTIGLGDD